MTLPFESAAGPVIDKIFSVMNLLNTILTGIITRRKAFALMRSVECQKAAFFNATY